MDYKIRKLEKKEDERGWLAEIIRSDEVGPFNQVHIVCFKSGQTRAQHYHKNRKEWFYVADGTAMFKLKDINTGETNDIKIGKEDFLVLEISKNIWHEIKNIGESNLMIVSATSDTYDKNNSDTYKL